MLWNYSHCLKAAIAAIVVDDDIINSNNNYILIVPMEIPLGSKDIKDITLFCSCFLHHIFVYVCVFWWFFTLPQWHVPKHSGTFGYIYNSGLIWLLFWEHLWLFGKTEFGQIQRKKN